METTAWDNFLNDWKTESVMQLANHFHKLDSNFQQRRVNHFEMAADDWIALSNLQNTHPITEIRICLALDKNKPTSDFSFFPLLEIYLEEIEGPVHFALVPCEAPETPPIDQEIVPEIFKDMILANWNTLDISLIDDLFIAQERDEDGNLLNQMVRVHRFIIDSDTIISHVNSIFPQLSGLLLYPGVDMNKFGNTAFISFTPVLGLTHLQKTGNDLGRMGVMEFAATATYLEYSRPCPPTCHKPPRKS